MDIGEPDTGLHHVHLYYDGNTADGEYDLVYEPRFTVDRLDPGEHTIEAVIANADHSLTDARTEITVTVGDAAGGGRAPPPMRPPTRRPPAATATERPAVPGDPPSGPVVRNNLATRAFHAATFVVTSVLLATGWWLRAGNEGRPSALADVLGTPDTEVHRRAGWALVALAAAGVTLGVRAAWTFVRETARVNRGDGRWFLRWPVGALTGRFRPHRGHFDPGQRARQRGVRRDARHARRDGGRDDHAVRRPDVRHDGARPPRPRPTCSPPSSSATCSSCPASCPDTAERGGPWSPAGSPARRRGASGRARRARARPPDPAHGPRGDPGSARQSRTVGGA